MLHRLAVFASIQVFWITAAEAQLIPLTDGNERIFALVNTDEIQVAVKTERGIKLMLKGSDREWVEIEYPYDDIQFAGEIWLGRILTGDQN